jgi:hypothetical protein
MSRLDEQLSKQFREWELRGRGWQVFDEPVCPEPPFRPFHGHYVPDAPPVDDGRKPTFLSSLAEKLSDKLSAAPPPVSVESEPEEEPESLEFRQHHGHSQNLSGQIAGRAYGP